MDELADRAASIVASNMRHAVGRRGRFLLTLSGGNTPRPAYQRLTDESLVGSLPWDQTLIYLGDERMVPCDHPESNYRMACECLLDHVQIPPWNVHRVETEFTANEAARLYDEDLRRLTSDTGRVIPRFDLILLGLGPDAHTASLFPAIPVLDNQKDLAAPVELPDSSEGASRAQQRVTMTYKVINAARRIVFLVAGDDKAEALQRVEEGDPSAPAGRVKPTDGDVQWLVVN